MRHEHQDFVLLWLCRFLFKPQPAVAQQLQLEAAKALTATPGALKIGIHLRLGDAEMEGATLCNISQSRLAGVSAVQINFGRDCSGSACCYDTQHFKFDILMLLKCRQ